MRYATRQEVHARLWPTSYRDNCPVTLVHCVWTSRTDSMVNDVHRIAHDLEELHSHGYGISGGSALQVGLTLPSVAELGDTEETSSHEWTSRLRGILTAK
mgnify:CR=1 FL=1